MPPIYIDQHCKVFVYNQHRLQNRHNGLRLLFYIDLYLVGFGTPFSIIEVASDWGYIDADVEIISTYTFRLFSGIHDTVTVKWWEREREPRVPFDMPEWAPWLDFPKIMTREFQLNLCKNVVR